MNIFQLFILQEKNLVNVSYFEILLKDLLWIVIEKADRFWLVEMEDILLFSLPIVT